MFINNWGMVIILVSIGKTLSTGCSETDFCQRPFDVPRSSLGWRSVIGKSAIGDRCQSLTASWLWIDFFFFIYLCYEKCVLFVHASSSCQISASSTHFPPLYLPETIIKSNPIGDPFSSRHRQWKNPIFLKTLSGRIIIENRFTAPGLRGGTMAISMIAMEI